MLFHALLLVNYDIAGAREDDYDGDDSDSKSDCEMSEDLVFSLLMKYSRD